MGFGAKLRVGRLDLELIGENLELGWLTLELEG